MDSYMASLAHALEFAMAAPGAVMALAPVRAHLRLSTRRACALVGLSLAILIAGGTAVCSAFAWPTNVVLVPAAFALFAPYARLVALPLPKKAFCYANAAMICAFSTMWTMVICSDWEAGNTANVLLPQTGALAIGMAALMALAFARTLIVKLPVLVGAHALDPLWRWLALIPAFMAAVIWWMTPLDLSLMLIARARPIFLAMTAFIPIVAWLLYHIAWKVASLVIEAGKLRQEVTLLRMEERRLADLRGYVDETRALRHDFRHHLLALSALADAGSIGELKGYLAQLTEAEAEAQRPAFCANAALDAVAAHYDKLARDRGIAVSWRLEVPAALPVTEADLCAVIGNLAENAIQAASCAGAPGREPAPWVDVAAEEVTPLALGITVRNSYEGTVSIGDDELPESDRPDHGIGLRPVASIAKRYDGTIEARAENGEFFAGVMVYHAPAESP